MAHEAIISVEKVNKKFSIKSGKEKQETVIAEALYDINLTISATDFAIIYGPSGCGKSTLLNTILGLEKPDRGIVKVRDTEIYNLTENQNAKFRNTKFGIIYQQPLWLKALNLIENVSLPLLVQGEYESTAHTKAKNLLIEFGLEEKMFNKPTEISGGQQQKAAAARALINNPWIIVADEPTGNLDTHSADELMSLFLELNKKSKRTIIMVTHNLIYLPMATKQIAMLDGKITAQEGEVEKQIKKEYKMLDITK